MTQSQNPFGEGGFDMNALLQQAQQMQEQMMSAQQELADTIVDGAAGDGMVSVSVDGTGELVSVTIRLIPSPPRLPAAHRCRPRPRGR